MNFQDNHTVLNIDDTGFIGQLVVENTRHRPARARELYKDCHWVWSTKLSVSITPS